MQDSLITISGTLDLDLRPEIGVEVKPWLIIGAQSTPYKRPAPVTSSDLAAMEKRLLTAISNRKPPKPETQSPFIRRKEAVKLLGCRSTLEKCEKAGWLTATTRRARLVQYKRQDVLNCAYRLSQGEYP